MKKNKFGKIILIFFFLLLGSIVTACIPESDLVSSPVDQSVDNIHSNGTVGGSHKTDETEQLESSKKNIHTSDEHKQTVSIDGQDNALSQNTEGDTKKQAKTPQTGKQQESEKLPDANMQQNQPDKAKPDTAMQSEQQSEARQSEETDAATKAEEQQKVAQSKKNNAATKSEEQSKTAQSKNATAVTISITGDQEMGVILPPTKVEVQKGDQIIDVTKKITKQKRIQMEYRGYGPTVYVEGINNLYEFDLGPKSGWMVRLNGEFISNSSGSVEVGAGDQIEWLYTVDLGKDIGTQ